ncbi:alpha/beta hydrolase [Ancylobacter sp. 6x-1]|uniref:Alpha/beta hydrolase n=1 Tax=Ancylobacter crimeensis TaxID=2579147 RepID=A0ABT0D8D3_9HYPH|nr:alpha/beta fold hydrolase [Ancylobacter crimeensis]MCK0196218.1 alpha/beta hydrolase [Ancylobacter crimeensis]
MPHLTASDGCRVHYDLLGTGTVPVVLIPGLGGDGRFWGGVVERMGERFRLVVTDHRGAGRSDRPAGAYRIGRIAQDVVELLDHLGLARAHLVGHSTGGAVVQTLALDHAARADRIVISGSWAGPDARFRAMFGARLALLEAGCPQIYQSFTHVLGFDAEWIAAHEAELDAAVARAGEALAPLDVAAERIRMLLAFDRRAELARITAPTLVLAARDDMLIPCAQSRAIATLIPGAAMITLSGGHFYPRTRPDAFADAVAGFLARAARPAKDREGDRVAAAG